MAPRKKWNCQGKLLQPLLFLYLRDKKNQLPITKTFEFLYLTYSGCPNYQITANIFFIFRSVAEGEGWFEVDYLINSLQKTKKPDTHPAVLLNSFKFCPPVFWFWLFISCLRERSFECVWVGGLRLRYYNFFPIILSIFFLP